MIHKSYTLTEIKLRRTEHRAPSTEHITEARDFIGILLLLKTLLSRCRNRTICAKWSKETMLEQIHKLIEKIKCERERTKKTYLKARMGPWNRNEVEQMNILVDGVAQSILLVHRNTLTQNTYPRPQTQPSHKSFWIDSVLIISPRFSHSTANQIVESLFDATEKYKNKHQEHKELVCQLQLQR